MSVTQRIVSGVKASLGASLIYAVANGLLMIVLARYLLTPEEFGLLHYALSIIASIAILGTIGLPSSAARYVTQFAEKSPDQVRYVVRFSVLAIIGLSVTVGAILSLASGTIVRVLGNPALTPLLVLGFVFVVTNALYKTFNRLFQSVNRVEWSARLKTISGVMRLLGAVALVSLGFGAAGALGGYVIGFGLAAAVGGVVFYRRYYVDFPPSEDVEPGLRRRILEYSVPLTATRGANILYQRVDTFLVGTMLGPAAVGYYTIARQISEFGSIPAQSLGYTISPTVGEQYAGEDIDRARRVYELSLHHTLLLYVPGAVGLVLVAEPTVSQLFGAQYTGAVPVLQVMAGFMLVTAVNKVTSDGLDFLGRARERAIAKVVTAVINVGLNVVLIGMVGVVGAAIATVITFSAYTMTNVYIIHDELDLDLRALGRLIVGVTAISAVMGGVVRLLLPLISGLVSLFLVIGVGVAVWGVLAVLGGLLDVGRVRAILS